MAADMSFLESVEKLPTNRSFKFRKLSAVFGCYFYNLACSYKISFLFLFVLLFITFSVGVLI